MAKQSPVSGWGACGGGGWGGGRSSRRAMKAPWSGRAGRFSRRAARRTPAMPRPSSTQRLAAAPEDAMPEESGLGLVCSARTRGNSRARVLARHPGVLRRAYGRRGGRWTARGGKGRGRGRRREKRRPRGGWIIPRAKTLATTPKKRI